MELISYKCPNCGGDLRFDPPSQKYKCEYCLSPFTQEELDQLLHAVTGDGETEEAAGGAAEAEAGADAGEGDKDTLLYNCPSCGAQIVTDETTTATFCYYCHNPVVLAGRMHGAYKPDLIIPFAVDKKKALQIFDQWIAGKKYIPKDFYSQEQIEKLSGVYFPHWLYDCEVEGKLDAEATRLNFWTAGNIRYTKTEKYDVSRDGRMKISNVARNALSKANRQLAEGVLPFEMEKLQPFQMGYLSGFMAENRDMEQDAVAQQIETEVKDFATSSLRSEISGYQSVQVRKEEARITDPKWKYALLPVWTLTYKDRRDGKIYYFACNGQTGKICGVLPVDKRRLAGLFASMFIPVFLLLLLVGYFL